jgi:pimeloyl-ACP methyl ester carboxylesterase
MSPPAAAVQSPLSSTAVNKTDIYYESADGLRLYACDYAHANTGRIPVLCLPGLTRNSKDFETLALDRRVIAADFRGRGLSQYANDPTTYRPDIELADTMALLNHLDIERVAVIGTSRGGIVGMLMAALHREKIAALLLNDIGTVLEPQGLLRIRSYLGVERNFTSWQQAIETLKATNLGFESLMDDEWLAVARRIFKTENGLPKMNCDPALLSNFASVEDIEAGRIPQLWELFAATSEMPISILRGEHSDLLSAATVAEMQNRSPDLDATTVRKRGHAPFLDEPESKSAIQRWLERVDALA